MAMILLMVIRKFSFGLICLLVLTACNLPLNFLPVEPTATRTKTAAPAPPPTETPTPTVPAYQPCAYTWAYKDLPDITSELQAAIQHILPEAEAHATAFGEDCVAQDGSATFGAMETDFYIRVPIEDLNDDNALGSIVEQVLPIIDEFPRPRVPGPMDGFVEFTFFIGNEQRVIRVPIPLGIQLRKDGLRGAELLRAIEEQMGK